MKDKILSHLSASHPWRGNIHYYTQLDSTNNEAKRMAAMGAPHGTAIVAGSQTGGRGRMGRSFHSPADSGIYLSVIIRPQCAAEKIMHLTCATAVAAAEALEAVIGQPVDIKWTNDLVIERKKLGGILTELSLNPQGTVDYAVIGIGVNCHQDRQDFPPEIADIATSVFLSCGQHFPTESMVAAILSALEQMCGQLESPSEILACYRKKCITLGQEISLLRANEVHHGRALDVDEQGALTVQFHDGHTEKVQSGEVSVRGMYGYI